MMTLTRRIIKSLQIGFLTLCTIFSGNLCFAAPTVSGFAGTITHGEPITLTGSGFGTKSHAAPLKWEPFEDGAVGATIDSTGYWDREAQATFRFTTENQRSPYTGKSVKIDGLKGTAGGVARKQIIEFQGAKKKLIGLWLRVDQQNLNGGQVKIFDLEATSAHASSPGLIEHDIWASTGAAVASGHKARWMAANVYFDDPDTSPANVDAAYHFGKWQYNLIELEESDPGQSNARLYFYKSQTSTPVGFIRKGSIPNKSTYSSSEWAHWLKLRAIFESGATGGDVYYDDVYIDDSWQRIEIGDKPIYANCTHREIQIPITWGDQRIQFKFNQGSFSNGQTVYVFVVDNNGVPNANGVAINIGQTSSSITPGSPTQPTPPQNLRITTNQ